MRRAGLFAAALLLSSPAFADSMDFSTLTCKDFIGANKDDMSPILMWLAGFYAGKGDETPVLDREKFVASSKKLGEYCAKNPTHSVLTSASKAFADD